MKFKDMVAIFLILLFSYTAFSKLLEHDRFVFQLKLSPLGEISHFALALSFLVPVVELGIATSLSAGIFIQTLLSKGLVASIIVMLSFEIYITFMLFSGKNLPCACGGIISFMSWKAHEIFNGITIILIAFALTDFKKSNAIKEKYSRV